jgi:competence protein ComEA
VTDGSRVRRAMLVGAIGALVIAAIYVLLRQKHTPDLLVQSDEGWQPDVRVSVAGEIVAPGMYTLRGDARVSDLIAAAGGYTDRAERNAFNPAARLGDGQQYVIPTQSARTATAAPTATRPATTSPAPTGAASPGAATATATPTTAAAPATIPATVAAATTPRATAAAATQININTATKEELELLPAIGPAIAQRIVDDRTAHGPFKQIEDLARVRGISARTVEQLRDRITVGA